MKVFVDAFDRYLPAYSETLQIFSRMPGPELSSFSDNAGKLSVFYCTAFDSQASSAMERAFRLGKEMNCG